jgi:hypothetical protein
VDHCQDVQRSGSTSFGAIHLAFQEIDPDGRRIRANPFVLHDVEATFPATKGFESYERETEMNAKIDCGCAGTGGPANGAFFGSEEPVSLSHPVESGSADPEDESGLMDVAIALPQGLHHGYSVQILAIENGK